MAHSFASAPEFAKNTLPPAGDAVADEAVQLAGERSLSSL